MNRLLNEISKIESPPQFLYGTAWKESKTSGLTELALQSGFRGIDTANQRKHYDEAAVGQAISESIRKGIVVREELFLQTKFTFLRGQDHRLPYDPGAPIEIQVQQSFDTSLQHLNTSYIDSYLLHGPTQQHGLAEDDWAAWRAMEQIYDAGLVRWLGISNVSLDQIELLIHKARIRPHFVQNRCYAVMGWDRRIRQFCKTNAVLYQGFSLLTGNPDLRAKPELTRIAERYHVTVNQIIFRFAMDVGMIPLTGTSDANHMRDDLDVLNFTLQPAEVDEIEKLVMR